MKVMKDQIVNLVFGHPDEHSFKIRRERISQAMKLLHRRDRLERTLLVALRNHPNDYFNAFTSISRNIRFIYIHAYQSYVWNKAVSERLKKFGKQVLIGDLVIKLNPENILQDNFKSLEEDNLPADVVSEANKSA